MLEYSKCTSPVACTLNTLEFYGDMFESSRLDFALRSGTPSNSDDFIHHVTMFIVTKSTRFFAISKFSRKSGRSSCRVSPPKIPAGFSQRVKQELKKRVVLASHCPSYT